MYLTADQVLQTLNRGVNPRNIIVDEETNPLDPSQQFVRHITVYHPNYTLMIDFQLYRVGRQIHDAATGISLHQKFHNAVEADGWYRMALTRYGSPSTESEVSDGSKNLFFCQLRNNINCDGDRAILVLGRSFELLSDCGYVDRMER